MVASQHPDPRSAAMRVGVAASVACVVAVALFWPGYVTFDGLAQYRQATTGLYDDWHPPVMARLWSVFAGLGPGPMLALQLGGYWLGLGLLSAGLAWRGRIRAAWMMLAIGLWPPLLGWQATVLKDMQMSGALIAATGIIGWWRLRDVPLPRVVGMLLILPIGYALLVRANAPFVVIPLIVMLIPGWRWPMRTAVGLAGIVAAILLSSPINHAVMQAQRSGVERTQALYDLVAIGVASDDPAIGLPHPALAAIRAAHCVRPYFWDPLGEPHRCGPLLDPLRAEPPGRLYARLAGMIVRHPIAYAAHRLSHLNSTERWWVPARWIGAAPPEASEPNTLGFADPGHAARIWQRGAHWLIETPLGWPIAWVIVAIAGLAVAGRDRPSDQLAAALFTSALTIEASFAVISIASDLRYHLWTLAATMIGWVLIGPRRWPRAMVALLAVVILIGSVARGVLPEAPQSYTGMLG